MTLQECKDLAREIVELLQELENLSLTDEEEQTVAFAIYQYFNTDFEAQEYR